MRFSDFISNLYIGDLSYLCLVALQQRKFSAISHQPKAVLKDNQEINLGWLIGFIDGEGCFNVSILKHKNIKTGWQVRLIFSIGLHEKDKTILESIQKSFGMGQIYPHGPESIQLKVSSKEEIEKLIEYLDKYSLLTHKYSDYVLWKKVHAFIKNQEHLTIEGLREIVAIRASINRGLSSELEKAFPEIIPIKRPLVNNQTISDPNWLTGFATAEGCFSIDLNQNLTTKTGFGVKLAFRLTQHSRDEKLIKSLMDYLNCGVVYKNKNSYIFTVVKFSDLTGKIIPLFKKYHIYGVKAKDFNDFCQAAELMKERQHLTKDGLDQIRKIKAGMNSKRKLE